MSKGGSSGEENKNHKVTWRNVADFLGGGQPGRVLSGRFELLRVLGPDCPRWLERLIRRMLDPVPSERPTAEQVAMALVKGRVPWVPRRRHILAATTLVVLTVAGGLGRQWMNRRPAVRTDILSQDVWPHGDQGHLTLEGDHTVRVIQGVGSDLDGKGTSDKVLGPYDRSGLLSHDDDGDSGLATLLVWTSPTDFYPHVFISNYSEDSEDGER